MNKKEANAPMVDHMVTIQLVNSRSTDTVVRLEPWADEHIIPQGVTYEVVARGPQGGTLEVEFGDDAVTIWCWEGSVVSLLHEGARVDVRSEEREPVPPVPPKTSVRGFLRSLLEE